LRAEQKDIDLLKDRHAKAFDGIAKKAWSIDLRGINQHKHKFREPVGVCAADLPHS